MDSKSIAPDVQSFESFWERPLLWILLGVSLASFLACLWMPLLHPVPILPWYDGVLLGTVERLQRGGLLYPGIIGNSHVPTETPYFPLGAVIAWATAGLFPAGLGPRILGTLSATVLLSAIWTAATALTKSRLGGGFFAVTGYGILLATADAHLARSFYPDYLMIATGIFAALVLSRTSEFRIRSASFVVVFLLLSTLGLLKQSSLAIFAGVGLFALLPGGALSRPARRNLIFCLMLAGLLVLSVVAMVPNCWAASVAAMSKHRIVSDYVVGDGRFVILTLFLWLVLPAAFFLSRKEVGQQPLSRILASMWLPLFLMQTLSAVKAGGGLYDFLPPALLLLPLAAAGLQSIAGERVPFCPYFAIGLLGIAISVPSWRFDLRSSSAERAEFTACSQYLERFRGQSALYNVYSYHLAKSAGLILTTDLHTLAHYALAGMESKAVLEEIDRQGYQVIFGIGGGVLDQTTRQSYFRAPALAHYGETILKNYRPLDDPAMPPGLRGHVYVPKGETPTPKLPTP